MARYPGTLESANTNEFGIVFADHIQGHRTVANLEALYKLSDAILSKSKNNTGNDAIGQEWYVISEKSVYRLDDWANRKQASGWRKLQNIDTEFDSLQSHGADKIKNFTTTANDVTLNYNTWKNSETSEDGTAVIPAATGDNAGVLTANGKDQLDQLNKIGSVSHMKDAGIFTKSASKLTFNYNCISTTAGATSAIETKYEDIPAATGDLAGVLTADGKDQLDQLNKIGEVTHLKDGGVITTDATKATIHYTCIDTTAGSTSETVEKTADIPAASLTNAGMLAADQRNQLEQLNKLGAISKINDSDDETTPTFTTTEDTVTLNYKNISSTAGANSSVVTKTADIPVVTQSKAGILTAADKTKLDITLPNQISAETSRATAREKELDNKIDTTKSDILGTASESGNTLGELEDRLEAEVSRATTKENQLQSSIDSNKGTIDNYTVNGIKISTNPVITGANAKVTGYSKPTSTSAIAATDSINAALGKLEKKADDHIANKSNPHGVTKAQVGLGNCDNTSDLNKPISTATQTALNSKVQTVEVTGTGNAITAASISGTKLTLTKGATYNNQTYTAGTNLSLSGNTFSLNSTISLTRVNASSGFFQTSDKRLKSNIKPLDHSLEDICSIPTDSFILNGKNDFGTIAQEVEDKFPELVSEAGLKESDVDEPSKFDKVEINGESYVLVKEVDYSKLSILAIEGIKLLKKEIEELKKQLNK